MAKKPQKSTKPMKARPSPFTADERLPKPGSTFTRAYKGKTLTVEVLEAGFRFDGREYRSLSALARAVTGAASINGFLFWGLNKTAGTPRTKPPLGKKGKAGKAGAGADSASTKEESR
jgi:hypothetical protein